MADSDQILQERNAKVEEIRGYADLTEEAKAHRVSLVTEKAQAEYAEAKEAEQRRIEENVISSRKAVYGVPTAGAISAGEVAQIHDAFRSAWADVQIATSSAGADPGRAQTELAAILDQAERTGDSLLARAAYHRGLDLGLQPVVDRYLQSRPKEARSLERYNAALEEENRSRSLGHLRGGALTEQALGGA